MIQFLTSHWLDFLVIVILAVPVGFSIRNLLPGRHHAACAGCSGSCSGGCSGCSGCADKNMCMSCPGHASAGKTANGGQSKSSAGQA